MNAVLSVNPVIIGLMVALQLLGYGFYSVAWYQLILATEYKIRFRTCFGIALASIFAVYVMPSGVFMEILRCVLGSKESGMPFGESTATVILHRILYIIGFLLSTAFALLVVLTSNAATPISLIALASIPAVAIIGLVLLLYFSLAPARMAPVLDRILKLAMPLLRRIQKEAVIDGKADRFLEEYNVGFREMLATRRRMVFSFASSLGDWTCSVAVLWVVLLALSAHVSLWIVLITVSIGRMIQMTPIAIPGMIGVYETAITSVLVLFGVPVSIAASAAILSRIVTAWLELPITGVAAYHYGFKFLGKGALQV